MRTLIGLLMGAVLLCGIGASVYDRNHTPTVETRYMLDSIPLGVPQSVVRVQVETATQQGHGTGFYIGNRQYITAAHVAAVVGKGGTVTLQYQYGASGKAAEATGTVLWIDTAADVALIQACCDLEPQGVVSAKLECQLPDASIGTSIVSIGYPLSLGLRYAWGHIASGTMTMPLDPDHNTYIGADIAIAPGNSGGPIFDHNGFVVGFADAMLKYNTEALLIPRSSICASLNSHKS